jgi:subtilisin-like proprotein convertase family protein
MKTMKLALVAGTAAALFLFNEAGAQTSFTNTLNQDIPDGNPVPLTSSITVSGLAYNLASISVNLDITGGFNGNLYAYLLGPNGGITVLLNRVGVSGANNNNFGYSDAGFNITLSDGSPDIHFYQSGSYTLSGGQLTDTWSPDGRNIAPNSTANAFDTVSTLNAFSVFDNINPNGQWTLNIADLVNGGGQSVFVNWSLTIVTVPEPQTWALMIGGAGALLALRRRKA